MRYSFTGFIGALTGVAVIAGATPSAFAVSDGIADGSKAAATCPFAPAFAQTVQATATTWEVEIARPGAPARFVRGDSEKFSIDSAGKRARLEMQAPSPAATGKAAPLPNLLIEDGTAQYELLGERHKFVKSNAPASLDTLQSRSGLMSPAISAVLGWSGYSFFPGPDTLDGSRVLKTYLATYSRTVQVTTPIKKPLRILYIITVLVDPATNLPVRFTEAYVRGAAASAMVPYARVDFSDWKLNQPIDSRQFVWNAPAGVTEYHEPVLRPTGAVATDFTAEKWGGGALKLSDYRGKVVVLDFWATWCGPCQASMPHVEKIAESIKGADVVVIGVCVWDDKAAYEKWVPAHQKQYTFLFGYDPAGRDFDSSIATKEFGVNGIPTTYVIDKDGTVAEAVVGFNGPTDHRLEAALGKVGITVPATSAAIPVK